jgi:hypothetical protein
MPEPGAFTNAPGAKIIGNQVVIVVIKACALCAETLCNPRQKQGWRSGGKKFSKCPQAPCRYDDKHYEGSLGHTRRLPGPDSRSTQPMRNSSWL